MRASEITVSYTHLDKRTSPGFDIAAKRKLWLSAEGLEEWDKGLLDLFFPTDEQEESLNNTLESPCLLYTSRCV